MTPIPYLSCLLFSFIIIFTYMSRSLLLIYLVLHFTSIILLTCFMFVSFTSYSVPSALFFFSLHAHFNIIIFCLALVHSPLCQSFPLLFHVIFSAFRATGFLSYFHVRVHDHPFLFQFVPAL